MLHRNLLFFSSPQILYLNHWFRKRSKWHHLFVWLVFSNTIMEILVIRQYCWPGPQRLVNKADWTNCTAGHASDLTLAPLADTHLWDLAQTMVGRLCCLCVERFSTNLHCHYLCIPCMITISHQYYSCIQEFIAPILDMPTWMSRMQELLPRIPDEKAVTIFISQTIQLANSWLQM